MILPIDSAVLLDNPGNGLCGIWSYFQGLAKCLNIARETEEEILNKIGEAMEEVKRYVDRNPGYLSPDAFVVVNNWSTEMISNILSNHLTLPAEFVWNIELIELYNLITNPHVEIYYFLEVSSDLTIVKV